MSKELSESGSGYSDVQGPRMSTVHIASVQVGLLDRLQFAPYVNPFVDFIFPADDVERVTKSPSKMLKSASGEEYSASVNVSTPPHSKQHSLFTLRVLHALVEFWKLQEMPAGEIKIHIIDLAECLGIDSESDSVLGGICDQLEVLSCSSLSVNPKPNLMSRKRWLKSLNIVFNPDDIKTSLICYKLDAELLAY